MKLKYELELELELESESELEFYSILFYSDLSFSKRPVSQKNTQIHLYNSDPNVSFLKSFPPFHSVAEYLSPRAAGRAEGFSRQS